MVYSAQQKEQAVAALQRQMPGLDRIVAYQWVNSEQGACNNILGVTSSSGHCGDYSGGHQGCGGINRLCSFDSFDSAAAAARRLIFGLPIYSDLARNIRAGNGAGQAQALVHSRWGGAPGWWPYFVALYPFYKNITPPDHKPTAHAASVVALAKRYPELRKYNVINSLFTGGDNSKGGGSGSGSGGGNVGGGGASNCGADPTVDAATGDHIIPAFSPACLAKILGVGSGHVITDADVQKIADWLSHNGGNYWQSSLQQGSGGTAQIIPFIKNYVGGKTVGESSNTITNESLNSNFDILGGLSGLGDQIVRGVMFLGILFVGIGLVIAAAMLVKKEPSGQPA